ncbi:MAG: FtsX-like permease family protein [Pseudomonadota bacterium]
MDSLLAVVWMNLRSIPSRLGSSLVIVVGVAGVVGVLTALLSLAVGFSATMKGAGSDDRVLVLQNSSTTELTSGLSQEELDVISSAPGVARDSDGRPLVSAEVLVVADVPKQASDSTANLSVRGVGESGPILRDSFEIVEGRMFASGRAEMIAGRSVSGQFQNLAVGDVLKARNSDWEVVGIFSTGGDAFESEVWVDAPVAQSAFRRGNSYQSVRVQLEDAAAFDGYKQALDDDDRLRVDVFRESTYYQEQSSANTGLFTAFGVVVGAIMAFGAIFGALNTMYTAVSTRTVEIATLRALGFGSGAVIMSVMVEALVLALLGGVIGAAIAYVLFDGFTVSTLNNSTFSQVAFAFAVTPKLLAIGLILALGLGFIGGFLPALRAASLPVTDALRER